MLMLMLSGTIIAGICASSFGRGSAVQDRPVRYVFCDPGFKVKHGKLHDEAVYMYGIAVGQEPDILGMSQPSAAHSARFCGGFRPQLTKG